MRLIARIFYNWIHNWRLYKPNKFLPEVYMKDISIWEYEVAYEMRLKHRRLHRWLYPVIVAYFDLKFEREYL